MASVEDDFLQIRLDELQETHPDVAQLARELIAAIAFEKGKLNDHAMAKHMVFSMCQRLTKNPERGLSGFIAWMGQFVKEGSLEQAQADAFIAQVQTIHDAKSH